MSSIKDLIITHERLTTVLRPKSSPSQDPSAAVHEVKDLYLSHKHRECSKRAVVHLSRLGSHAHPLHRAALYFYAGLSYDTLARNMPYRSAQIFASLDQAQLFYQHAIEALEVPELQMEKRARGSNSPVKPQALQTWSVPAASPSASQIPRLRPSPASLTELGIEDDLAAARWKTPSRKGLARMQVALGCGSPTSPTKMLAEQPASPEVKISSPRKISSLAYLAPGMQKQPNGNDGPESGDGDGDGDGDGGGGSSSSSSRTVTPTGLGSQVHLVRFNTGLEAFAGMVYEHSAAVARFRQKVWTKQTEEHSPALFSASGRFQNTNAPSTPNGPGAADGPSDSRMSWDEMVVRIDRLRAKNWAMPRFEVAHYEDLRQKAMGDLQT